VPHGFQIGRALQGLLAGALPVGHGLRHQACLGVVMGQQFRLRLLDFRKPLHEHLRNLSVELLTGALEQ
jgi:hypothetical protein